MARRGPVLRRGLPLALLLALVPLALVLDRGGHGADAWARLAAVCAGVAVLASIVGNALWNKMSRLLPLTLVGQMILFETLFALLYGFLWERRFPTPPECAAFVLVVLSVTSCISAHRTPAPEQVARMAGEPIVGG